VPYCKGVSIGHKFVHRANISQKRPSSKQVRFSKQPSQGVVPAQCSSYTGVDGDSLQQAGATGILLCLLYLCEPKNRACFGSSPNAGYNWRDDLDLRSTKR